MALGGESRAAASEVVPGGSRGGLGPVLKMPWLCPGSLGMAILGSSGGGRRGGVVTLRGHRGRRYWNTSLLELSILRTIELGGEEKGKASLRHLSARVNGLGGKGTSDDIKMTPASLRDYLVSTDVPWVTFTRREAHICWARLGGCSPFKAAGPSPRRAFSGPPQLI